jgi:ligand-binding sensor domain-containing protein
MKKNYTLFLLGLTLNSLSIAQSPPLRFTHFTVKEGLPQSYGNCLFQDHHGFIWIGTNSGVCRYDGFGFTSFRNYMGDSTSLSSSQINDLNEDKNGNIWVGTRKGVNLLNPYTGKNRRVTIPHNNVVTTDYVVHPKGIYRDTKNRMWVCTNKGLFYYQSSTKTLQPFLISFPNSTLAQKRVFQIYQEKKGGYWATVKDGLLVQFDKVNRQAVVPKIYVNNRKVIIKYVSTFFEDDRGYLWIGTANDGLYRIHQKTYVAEHFKKAPLIRNSLSHNTIVDIEQDKNGLIWIGTSNNITTFNPQTRTFHHYAHVPVS